MSAELKTKLIALLEEQFSTADRMEFDYEFLRMIKTAGYYLQQRVAVNLSNSRRGFVDYLVTSPDGQLCAIEIDKKTPRKRSLMKLRELPEGVSGFVLLRDGKHPLRYVADGIDVVRATRFQ